MKRKLLSIIVFLATVMATFAQKPFYVYLNDGSFKAFLTSQIDSMSISRIDAKGAEHSDYVMQEFWTPDSLYRIPIEQIDSIGFTTPKTQFQPDAINVAESLAQYVISADSTHIYLKLSTPKRLIPSIGEKLGYPTMDQLFPYGFSGRVQTVTTRSSDIEVSCEQIGLGEVFETFYLTMVTENEEESHAKGVSPQFSLTEGEFIKLPRIHIPFPKLDIGSEISANVKKDSNLALNYGTSASIELDNNFDVTMFIVVNKEMGTNVQISSIGHHDLTTSCSVSGGISNGKEKEFASIREYLGYGIFLYAAPGWFYNASATLSLQANITQHFVSGISFEYSSVGAEVLKPSISIRPTDDDSNVTAAIDGTIALGAYFEGGFTFAHEAIDKVVYRFEAGAELSSSCALWSSDFEETTLSTGLYQRLKTAEITLSPFISHSLVIKALNFEVKPALTKITFPPLWKRTLVPTFSNTKVDVMSIETANVTTDMSGNCLIPVTVGYKLFDESDNFVDKYVSPVKYTNQPSVLDNTFVNLQPNSRYTVYPMVELFGLDVLAVPEKNIKTELKPAKVIDVKVTDFSEGSYYNEGIAYKYKFNVATTVELESLNGVADWGYVYIDPHGKYEQISLMGHSSPYTDNSYAYYRNEIKSSAHLLGYVKYKNDSIYYDDPIEWPLLYIYTCPDNNHPHAIDLGLPSGTKWCCMNVGASSPEDDGNLYAWGETSTKEVCSFTNYQYVTWIDTNGDGEWDNRDTWFYHDIGTEIAGTTYDAAHVNMGGSWQMPNYEQLQELVEKCTSIHTQINGAKGMLFKGKNGNRIFLPESKVEGYGTYWSSTRTQNIAVAYSLHFFWFGHCSFTDNWCRDMGRSVRAVCP